MSENEVIKKVRDILNEHVPDGAVSLDGITEDRVLLEDYIESAIPDAVVMLAQKGYAVNVGTKIFTLSGMANTAVEGFVSFLEARSSGWKKVITALTPTDSPEYKMAQNAYTAPGPHSPIAWMERGEKSTFHFLPIPNTGITMTYNKVYTSSIDAEPKEATAVCYMTAAIVLGMFGDDNGKQRLSDISMNILQ